MRLKELMSTYEMGFTLYCTHAGNVIWSDIHTINILILVSLDDVLVKINIFNLEINDLFLVLI